MLKSVVDVTIPALVFLRITVVGLELSADDFRRVAHRFRVVAVATAVRVILWPLVAVTFLDRIEFAVFATAYFLNRVPLLMAALVWFRLTRSSDPAATKRADHEPARDFTN